MKTSINNKYLLGRYLNGIRVLGRASGDKLIFAELYKIATGTDITITDTKNDIGRITGFECASSQVVTIAGSGKNKWLDNTTINLTNTTKTHSYNNQTIPTSSYNFSADASNIVLGTNSFLVIFAELYYSDSTSNVAFSMSPNITTNGRFNRNITIPKNVTRVVLKLSSGAYTNGGSITLSNLQLEVGSTSTAFEAPIQNSPSPDYPSQVNNTGNDGTIDTTTNGIANTPITLPVGYVGGSLPNGVKDTHDIQYIKSITFSGQSVTIADMKSNGSFYSTRGGTISDKTITLASVPSGDTTVYYELATPIDVSSSIALPNINTYKVNTIITSTNTVKPSLTVEYLEK